jgi:hypothetical protein
MRDNLKCTKQQLEQSMQDIEREYQHNRAALNARLVALEEAKSMLRVSQSIHMQAHLRIVNGSSSTSLPEEVQFTEELLDRICQSRRINMVEDSYQTICKNLGVPTWHDVQNLTKEQGTIILKYLMRKGFMRNQCFLENINHYKQLKVIPNDFNDKKILCQQHMGVRTIHGLIGIYMKLLPINMGVFKFMLNNKSPWSTEGVDAPRDADSSGVTRSVTSSGDPAPMNAMDISTASAFKVGNVGTSASVQWMDPTRVPLPEPSGDDDL